MSWREMEFEELYAIPSKNGLTRPASVRGLGYKMINMGELFAHDRIGNVEMELVQLNEKEVSTMLVEPGDLLFARQSLVLSGAGKCSLVSKVEEPTTFESHIIRVRLKQDIANPFFFHYYFKSPVCRIRSIVTQGVQAGIRGNDLKKLKVHLPPISEQTRIASILSAYDDLIENNRRRIQLLEQAARLLYKEWFVHLRFPGHEHVKVLDGLPEGWMICAIKEHIEGLYDGPHATPPSSDDGPIFLGIKNISETGQLDLSTVRHIAENDFPSWTKRVTPQAGDIVFSYEATLNLYALIPSDFRGCLGRRLALIRPNAKERNGLFIYLSFFSKNWRDVIESNRLSGATVDRIPLAKFPDFPLLLPPKHLIWHFDDQVKPMFEQLQVLNKQNQKLIKARDLLLPRLMNGDLVI